LLHFHPPIASSYVKCRVSLSEFSVFIVKDLFNQIRFRHNKQGLRTLPEQKIHPWTWFVCKKKKKKRVRFHQVGALDKKNKNDEINLPYSLIHAWMCGCTLGSNSWTCDNSNGKLTTLVLILVISLEFPWMNL
jgi:hypothetical protein